MKVLVFSTLLVLTLTGCGTQLAKHVPSSGSVDLERPDVVNVTDPITKDLVLLHSPFSSKAGVWRDTAKRLAKAPRTKQNQTHAFWGLTGAAFSGSLESGSSFGSAMFAISKVFDKPDFSNYMLVATLMEKDGALNKACNADSICSDYLMSKNVEPVLRAVMEPLGYKVTAQTPERLNRNKVRYCYLATGPQEKEFCFAADKLRGAEFIPELAVIGMAYGYQNPQMVLVYAYTTINSDEGVKYDTFQSRSSREIYRRLTAANPDTATLITFRSTTVFKGDIYGTKGDVVFQFNN